jgi:hypothetical protein
MFLAHPLTEPSGLPISPIVAAVLAVTPVAAVAIWWPRSDEPVQPRAEHIRDPDLTVPPMESWTGRLSRAQIATRAIAVGLLLLSVVAGRAGIDDELENLAPALVVGAAWPLMILGSAIAGAVWRWLDPWDGLARAFGSQAGDRGRPPDGSDVDVRPALVPALAWVWYLSAYFDPLSPRSVAAALAIYTIATLAGCLALGRVRWLPRAEAFGLLFGWIARLPRRLLPTWRPPKGADLVLGVLAGGLVFGAVRRSALWGALNTVPNAQIYAAVGVVLSSLAAAGLLRSLSRWAARLGSSGSVAAVAVPSVASLALAFALARNRFTTSLQLLPGLLGDPFGFGWDLLGRAGAGLDPEPLGDTGLVLLQVAVLVAGHLAGAVVLGRRAAPRARDPGLTALAVLLAAGVAAVTAT